MIRKVVIGIFCVAICAFNVNASDVIPDGWSKAGRAPQDYEVGIDKKIFHSAPQSYYIKSVSPSPNKKVNGTFIQKVDASQYIGKRIQLTVFVKLTKGFAYFSIQRYNEQQIYQWINHESDWHQIKFVFDVSDSSQTITYGLSLWGAGQVWMDDVEWKIVDKSVALKPVPSVKEPTNLP